MKKFVPRVKLGKKAKRKMDLAKRQIWAVSPVTRKSDNPKAYVRKKARYRQDEDGIGLFVYGLGSWACPCAGQRMGSA